MKLKILLIFFGLCAAFSKIPAYAVQYAEFAQHYDAGKEYMLQNQYSSSIVEFRKALRINYLDKSAATGLINAYLARAEYYANQGKEYDKAANDFRSALFYLKLYPADEQTVQNSLSMISSAEENLNLCLRTAHFDFSPASEFKRAEELRAIGNFSASAYAFSRAAQDAQYKTEAFIQIADLFKLLGNESRSADYFKTALDMKPEDQVLRMKYARTLDKLGRFDEAAVQYGKALENSKGDMEILYALERIYLKKLAQSPSNAELNADMGAIKQAQGDFETALNYYAQADRLDSSNVNTRLNIGTLFQQKKEYQKALQAYDSVLTLYPENTQAILYKAQLYRETGDNNTALNLYQKVLSLEPDNSAAQDGITAVGMDEMTPSEYIDYLSKSGDYGLMYNFAYKLHKENKIDDAINAYKAVISNDGSNVNAYVNLAVCFAAKEDYKSAEDILNTAKIKFPSNKLVSKTLNEVRKDFASSKLALAASSYEAGNYSQAAELYLAVSPVSADSLLGAAASFQALRDYDKAIEYYKKASELSPDNAEIPYYIGCLYSEKQDWVSAETYLKKAASMNPELETKDLLSYASQNNILTVLNAGISLYEQNDFQAAVEKFNEVLQKDSQNAYAYYYRGLIYDERKQVNLAISDYLNVLKYSDEFPIVNYMLAADYDGENNYKEAQKYYQKFISSYTTDDEYLKYAKSRLEELREGA